MNSENQTKKVDWIITIVPLSVIVLLCTLFVIYPQTSNDVISSIRFFFGDTLGVYYLIVGLGFFLASMYLAFSKYGNIVLGGKNEKPQYSFFTWGAMMFTAGLAADILFYSFSEWFMYSVEPYIGQKGGIQEWAGVYPLYHWSFIPWSFYLVLAVAFGFMLHVRRRSRQKYSEACRPILGKHTRWMGRGIDLLAVFALIAGTATTFSVATPLMTSIINGLFHLDLPRTLVTIVILACTCCIYTYALLKGFKGIGALARACVYMFFALLAYVLLFGGEAKYIIETGFTSLGRMVQNFFELSTYTDPLRENFFPQNWTIYFWAYWMVWSIATPFFIGNISKGRTIRQTILGGYAFGVGSTIISFIILGNYSMGLQMTGLHDFLTQYTADGDPYTLIISIINTLPAAPLVLTIVLLTMIAFYCTSFDSIALIASKYSYTDLPEGTAPDKKIELMWCILLILLPMALVFIESPMNNLQSVSIIAAFPIGIVMILIVLGLFKDANKYLSEK